MHGAAVHFGHTMAIRSRSCNVHLATNCFDIVIITCLCLALVLFFIS